MGKRRHSEEDLPRVSREGESGKVGGDLPHRGISQQTFRLEKKKHGGYGLSNRGLRGRPAAHMERPAQTNERSGLFKRICLVQFESRDIDRCSGLRVSPASALTAKLSAVHAVHESRNSVETWKRGEKIDSSDGKQILRLIVSRRK